MGEKSSYRIVRSQTTLWIVESVCNKNKKEERIKTNWTEQREIKAATVSEWERKVKEETRQNQIKTRRTKQDIKWKYIKRGIARYLRQQTEQPTSAEGIS